MFQQKQSRCIISIDTKTFKDPLGNMDIIWHCPDKSVTKVFIANEKSTKIMYKM